MRIPFLLALLLVTTTNADDDLKNIGSAAGAAVVVSATTGAALGPAVGIAVGAYVGGALVRAGVDSGIKWAQDNHIIDNVHDENIPILQDTKSMVEPWLAAIRSRLQGLDQTMREQHHLFADFVIESVTDYMEKYSPTMAKMQDIDKIINKISFRYQRMQTYKTRKPFEKTTLSNFAQETLSILQDSLNELHVTLLGDEDRPHVTPNNVLVQLGTRLKASPSHMCRMRQSAQQFFYLLQESIVLTEFKALALADYSWTLLKEQGEFAQEKRLMLEEYQRRTIRTLRMFKGVISGADRTVWRCDPAHHIPGVTYEEVTRLLQGYIENEVDLNADNSCKKECSYYHHSKNNGCYDDEELCKKQQPCTGNVHNCQYVESTMTVCLTDETAIKRYEYVEYKSGHRYGQGGKCRGHTKQAESWSRWIFWQCSYCMCLCDEQGPRSDRFFNLRPVTADVKRNRVVTGLRFVKHNRILHLQIQEGELLPKGIIKQSTLQWKPVEEYRITDRNVRQNVDYHMLTYDRRSVDLNELEPLNNTFLITGLRFKKGWGNLHLEAQYSEFDFLSGKLVKPAEQSYWETGKLTQNRGYLRIEETRLPTIITNSMPSSESYNFLAFTHTSFEHDAGQTTVPFIDIQEVVSNPPVPLSGIGIYYKGRPGYGGFLGPKIVNFDLAPYL